jgi:hemerythrin-like domain-containing protein
MKPTEILMQEHRNIERLLNVLEVAVNHLEQGITVPADVFSRTIEFARVFADQCHHGKEEDTLFPAMEKHDVPADAPPISIMLGDHTEGRAYVRAMSEAVADYDNPASKKKLAANARDYIALLREHIVKEDDVLFPMADMLLSDSEQRALQRQFAELDAARVGAHGPEYQLRVLEALEREALVAA